MVKYPSLKRAHPSILSYLSPLEPYPSWIPYYHWRHAEILAAAFKIAGLLTATMDYEHRYSGDRSHNNCKEGDVSDIYRWWTFGFTVLAILFTLIRYYLKLQWFKKKQPKYFKSIWTYEAFKAKRFKTGYRVCLEILYLCIFPYPNLSSSTNFATVEYLEIIDDPNYASDRVHVCYTLAELLYVLMFFRIVLLIRAVLTGTQFQDDLSNYFCNQYRQSPNFIFTIKCLMRNAPVKFSVFSIVPGVFIFGTLIRIFERPFSDVSQISFESYLTSIWCASVTITTIGYGTTRPFTHLGKMIAIICAFWGLFMFSLLVSALDSTFQLNTQQKKAYIKIRKIRASAYLMRSALQYNYAKKCYGSNSAKASDLYAFMLKDVEIYKQKAIRTNKIKSEQKFGLFTLSCKIIELSKRLNIIEENLEISDKMSGASHS